MPRRLPCRWGRFIGGGFFIVIDADRYVFNNAIVVIVIIFHLNGN